MLYNDRALIKRTMFPKVALLACLLAGTSAVSPHLGYGNQNVNQTDSPIGSRIVGGTEAKPHEFPHIVSLQYRNEHFCGGSILNKNWIVTAAHCVNNKDDTLIIKAGKHLVLTKEKSEQTIKVVKIFTHEDFGGEVEPDDIALLKLQKPLVFNKYVQPIALPKRYSEVVGDVIVTGWGSTRPSGSGTPKKLQKATLPVIDLYTCKEAFASLSDEPAPLEDTNVCTGPLAAGLSPCAGDSGGPLFKQEAGKSELVGIVSWGYYPCGTRGAPSVFTKVSYYIDWIENVMAKN